MSLERILTFTVGSEDGRNMQFEKRGDHYFITPPEHFGGHNIRLPPFLARKGIGTAIVYTIGNLFNDELTYGSSSQGAFVSFIEGNRPELVAMYSDIGEEGIIFSHKKLAPVVRKNLGEVLSNVQRFIYQGTPSQKLRGNGIFSAASFLADLDHFNEIRPSQYPSLDDYNRTGEGLVEVGDKIMDVELTGRNKKQGWGTFSFIAGKVQTTVVVVDSTPGSHVGVSISEKLNANLYRATII